MLINILHWLMIAGQFGNVALGVVPPKVQPYIAGGLAVIQYVTHLLDKTAPSIGAGR
jgi:hypothetical protein